MVLHIQTQKINRIFKRFFFNFEASSSFFTGVSRYFHGILKYNNKQYALRTICSYKIYSWWVYLTESFFLSKGVSQFRVVPSLGATESYLFTGSSELITDITPGSTLKANNLRIINDGIILKSSACIFVSKKIKKNNFLNLIRR